MSSTSSETVVFTETEEDAEAQAANLRKILNRIQTRLNSINKDNERYGASPVDPEPEPVKEP
jgi:hypothetical protein